MVLTRVLSDLVLLWTHPALCRTTISGCFQADVMVFRAIAALNECHQSVECVYDLFSADVRLVVFLDFLGNHIN